MKVLLEKSLDNTLTMKDLLIAIFQAEAPGLSLLKLANSKKDELGEVYFLGGRYIVGATAKEKTPVSGLAALDHLLQLKQAHFVYSACDSLQSLPQSQDLKIDLRQMIDHWQDAKPFSEEQLLDKIFNIPLPTHTIDGAATTGDFAKLQEMEDSLAAEDDFGPITTQEVIAEGKDNFDWDMVEPLVSASSNSEAGAQTGWTTGTNWTSNSLDILTETPETSESRATYTQELRAITSEISWQRQLRSLSTILAIFLIACTVIFFSAWLMVNMPSSHLSPRRFSVSDPEKHGPNRTPKPRHDNI